MTPWTVVCQALLSMEFSRQEYWSGWPLPYPGSVPFSRGYSQARNQTRVSHIVGGFFTISATREAQEYWSGKPIPSPGHLPNSGVKPGSPALQAHSLQAELLGKPLGDKLTQPVELCSKFETFYKGKNFLPVSSLYESLDY